MRTLGRPLSAGIAIRDSRFAINVMPILSPARRAPHTMLHWEHSLWVYLPLPSKPQLKRRPGSRVVAGGESISKTRPPTIPLTVAKKRAALTLWL